MGKKFEGAHLVEERQVCMVYVYGLFVYNYME